MKEVIKTDLGINTAVKDRLDLVLKRIKSKMTRAEQIAATRQAIENIKLPPSFLNHLV